MVVRIRLQRFGQRNLPFYRIVVANSKSPRDGKFIERVSPPQYTVTPALHYCFSLILYILLMM